MYCSVAFTVVLTILAQSHFGCCSRYGGQTTNSGYDESGSQSAKPNSGEVGVYNDKKPTPGSKDKNTLVFCEVQEAEKAAFNEATVGLDAMFDAIMKIFKKHASTNERPTVKEDSPTIKASQDITLTTFPKSGEINFGTILKLQPRAKNIIQKISNSISPMFRDAIDGVYRAIRLSYIEDPREVQSQIDYIEPETLALFSNGIAGFYSAMRQATSGKLVIIATNKRAEEKSVKYIRTATRQVFFAIRYMLDAVVKGKQYGESREYLFEIRKARDKSVSAMQKHFRALYNEMRRWGGVQSGDEKSCKASRDIQ